MYTHLTDKELAAILRVDPRNVQAIMEAAARFAAKFDPAK
jgi:plasmid maintenance system antidote protein VapI